MTGAERRSKIESYGSAYSLLVEALKEFPRECWQHRPSEEDWTIHETVVHIADSEANSYIRGRRFIAEPGSTVLGYDEEAWAKALKYHDRSPEDALELFKALRGTTYDLLKSLPEATWQSTVEHSESGTMTMDEWLDIYDRHIPEHIEQMRRVHADWRARSA